MLMEDDGHTLNRPYKCLIHRGGRLTRRLSGIKYFTPTLAVEFNVQRFDVFKQDNNADGDVIQALIAVCL